MGAYPAAWAVAAFSPILVLALSIAVMTVMIGFSVVLRGYTAVELVELGYGANLRDQAVRAAVLTSLRTRLFAWLVGAAVLGACGLGLWLWAGPGEPPAFYNAVFLALPAVRVARLRDLCAAHRPPPSSEAIFPLAEGRIGQTACSIGAHELGMGQAAFWRAYLIGM